MNPNIKRCNDFFVNLIVLEAATEGVPRNEVFLKLLQDSQENTFTRVSSLITRSKVFPREFNEIFKSTSK